MATSLENKRAEYYLKWFSEFFDWNTGGYYDPYYAYSPRRILSTEKRALQLAKAYVNRFTKIRQLLEDAKKGNEISAMKFLEYRARDSYKTENGLQTKYSNDLFYRPRIIEWVEITNNKSDEVIIVNF